MITNKYKQQYNSKHLPICCCRCYNIEFCKIGAKCIMLKYGLQSDLRANAHVLVFKTHVGYYRSFIIYDF